jgi:hypothetical protein
MSDTGRNVFGSCLTMTVTIGVILSILVIVGMGVMIFSLMAGA